MAGVITYAKDIGQDIEDLYNKCAEHADAAIEYLRAAASVLEGNYKGQGADIALTALDKLCDHVAMLRSCCENAGAFVAGSFAVADETDKKSAALMEGGVS